MRLSPRTYALLALVVAAGCATPVDEANNEPEPVDAGSDARRPSPQDGGGGSGGAGGAGGGGGWGGSGGSGGGDELDAGEDAEAEDP